MYRLLAAAFVLVIASRSFAECHGPKPGIVKYRRPNGLIEVKFSPVFCQDCNRYHEVPWQPIRKAWRAATGQPPRQFAKPRGGRRDAPESSSPARPPVDPGPTVVEAPIKVRPLENTPFDPEELRKRLDARIKRIEAELPLWREEVNRISSRVDELANRPPATPVLTTDQMEALSSTVLMFMRDNPEIFRGPPGENGRNGKDGADGKSPKPSEVEIPDVIAKIRIRGKDGKIRSVTANLSKGEPINLFADE